MKKIVYFLFCLVLASCTGHIEENIEEMKPAQARSAGTGLYSNSWGIQNMVQSGKSVSYELVYKNTTSYAYICSSLYTMVLYKGAYDGYYGGYSIDWRYNSTSGLYFPEEVSAEYGLCVREFDACDGGKEFTLASNQTRIRPGHFQLPDGKTLADIEYVLFFIYDNENGRYVDICDFYNDVK